MRTPTSDENEGRKKRKGVTCECATRFVVRLAYPSDYPEFKRIIDKGRYPGFMGRSTMQSNAVNGGALFYHVESEPDPIAVSLINPHLSVSLAIAVVPAHQRHGLGTAIVEYLRPNFRRVILENESWIRRCKTSKYEPIGTPHKGRKFLTQLMVRSELIDIAGRAARVLKEHCGCVENTGHRSNGNRRVKRNRLDDAPVAPSGSSPNAVALDDHAHSNDPESAPVRQ